MTTTILRPNATTDGAQHLGSNIGFGGSASTIHGALSDNNDSTYVRVNSTYEFTVAVGTFAIPAGNVVKSVQARARLSGISGSRVYVSVLDGSSGLLYVTDYLYGDYGSSTTESGTIATSAVSATWPPTQSGVDGLRLKAYSYASSGGAYQDIHEMYLYVVHAAPPTTPTWSAPSGTIANTLRPLHNWNHNAGSDGGSQTKFRVKVFTLAQTQAGGFDPATSSATLDSGVVTSSSTQWVPHANLSNGETYRSYVTTYATTNGVDQPSPWSAAASFDIAIPVPLPTAVTPAQGATVTSSTPAVGATVAAMTGGVLIQRQWTVASDNGFTADVQTVNDTGFSSSKSGTISWPGSLNRLPAGNWYIRCRSVDQYGQASNWTSATWFTISHSPGSTSRQPSAGVAKAYGATTTVTWTFTDPDPNDYQTKYRAELWKQTDKPGTVIDSGETTSGTSSHEFAIPDGTWKEVDLRWRVRTYDQDDTVGAWSAEQSFFLYDAPAVTITSPTQDEVITSAQPTFTWTFAADAGRTQQFWRVVVTEVGTGVIADSGTTAGTDLSWQLPSPLILLSEDYTVAVTITDSVDLATTITHDFTATYALPTTPTMSLNTSNFEDQNYVFVDWSTSTQDGTNLGWRAFRRPTGSSAWEVIADTDTATKTFRDYLAPSSTDVQYAVAQIAESFGDPVESPYATESFYGEAGYAIVCPDEPSLNMQLYIVTSDDFEDEQEMATQNLIGRGRRVEYGTRFGQTGSLTADFRDRVGGDTARQQRLKLEALRDSGLPIYLRNPFGDVWAIAAQSAQISRVAGVGLHEMATATITYTEITA